MSGVLGVFLFFEQKENKNFQMWFIKRLSKTNCEYILWSICIWHVIGVTCKKNVNISFEWRLKNIEKILFVFLYFCSFYRRVCYHPSSFYLISFCWCCFCFSLLLLHIFSWHVFVITIPISVGYFFRSPFITIRGSKPIW